MNATKSPKPSKSTKSKARLKYGGGYIGLVMSICKGDRTLARQRFGILI